MSDDEIVQEPGKATERETSLGAQSQNASHGVGSLNDAVKLKRKGRVQDLSSSMPRAATEKLGRPAIIGEDGSLIVKGREPGPATREELERAARAKEAASQGTERKVSREASGAPHSGAEAGSELPATQTRDMSGIDSRYDEFLKSLSHEQRRAFQEVSRVGFEDADDNGVMYRPEDDLAAQTVTDETYRPDDRRRGPLFDDDDLDEEDLEDKTDKSDQFGGRVAFDRSDEGKSVSPEKPAELKENLANLRIELAKKVDDLKHKTGIDLRQVSPRMALERISQLKDAYGKDVPEETRERLKQQVLEINEGGKRFLKQRTDLRRSK